MRQAQATVVGTTGITEIIDPRCVAVVPGHDLMMHNLPNGNVLLTLLTHHIETDGTLVGVVTCRAEWVPERLKIVHEKLMAQMAAGPLATMAPVNLMAG